MWWGSRGYEFPVIGKNSMWQQLYKWLLPSTRGNLVGVNPLLDVLEMLLESAWLNGEKMILVLCFSFCAVSNLLHEHKQGIHCSYLISSYLRHYDMVIKYRLYNQNLLRLYSIFLRICYLSWASAYFTKYYCCVKELHI